MKQTAVEWLEQHLFLDDNWKKIFEQAKEMEKEQIIEAFIDGASSKVHGSAHTGSNPVLTTKNKNYDICKTKQRISSLL